MVPVTLNVIVAPVLANAIASRSVHWESEQPVPLSASEFTTGAPGTSVRDGDLGARSRVGTAASLHAARVVVRTAIVATSEGAEWSLDMANSSTVIEISSASSRRGQHTATVQARREAM